VKLLALLGALALAGALSIPVRGGQQQPFSFQNTSGGSGQSDYPLEEYNPYPLPADRSIWIVNPIVPACDWDINDHVQTNTFTGFLDPSGSSSDDTCMVSYSYPTYSTRYGAGAFGQAFGVHGLYGIAVVASSPGLTVTICYQPQNRCFTPQPLFVYQHKPLNSYYTWTFCGHAVYTGDPLDATLVEIGGSGGGYGLISTITATVSNNSLAQVKGISARWGYTSDVTGVSGCVFDNNGLPVPQPPANNDYPFIWSQS